MCSTNLIPFLLLFLAPSALARQDAKPQTTEERLAALEKKFQESQGGDSMRVFWKDGLRLESADKRYKLKIGGRIHYDVGFLSPDDDTRAAVETTSATSKTRIEDGSEIRRARIELSGEVGDRTEWATSYDFGGTRTNLRNAYVGVKGFPFGNVRAGQYKEPYGLEQLTSSNHLLFLERSLMNAFVPAFNAGVMVFDQAAEERVTWAVGAFRTGTDDGEVSKGSGEWAATARVTGLPVFSEDGRRYVHLGLGLSHRSPTDDLVTFASKPEANLAPNYVQASNVAAESLDLVGGELGFTSGPLTVSGEYTVASVDGPSGSADPTFNGYYVQASWLLTGESRPYRKANGCFDAVKPAENAFGKEHGLGAWELAARYSAIDLVDDGIDRGELDDVTVGVNWYLNPNTRVMVDYVLASLDPAGGAAEGDTNALLFRFQFAF
jgi:phosphate-selective porin OprO/OprP